MMIQNGRHKNGFSGLQVRKSVCRCIHKHENVHRDTLRSAERKFAGSQSQFSTGLPYWMIQNGRYKKTALFCYWPEKVYKNLCASLKICTEVH